MRCKGIVESHLPVSGEVFTRNGEWKYCKLGTQENMDRF